MRPARPPERPKWLKRRLALVAALALVCASLGCDRPLVVRADPTATEKLAIVGAGNRTGRLARALKVGSNVIPEGTRVGIEETWLLRKDPGGKTPGYRVSGMYDPVARHDGLVLPKGAVDVYFLSAILPERRARIPVPQEAIMLDP